MSCIILSTAATRVKGTGNVLALMQLTTEMVLDDKQINS